jgi:hypothetical protein
LVLVLVKWILLLTLISLDGIALLVWERCSIDVIMGVGVVVVVEETDHGEQVGGDWVGGKCPEEEEEEEEGLPMTAKVDSGRHG